MRYQTLEFGTLDVHLRTLRSTNEFKDDDGVAAALGISSAHWSLFGMVWDSSQVLARLMLDRPVDGLRVLEVGCGIGLASLVLNHREADITATDRHPEAEGFLAHNVGLNDGADIPFVRAGWDDAECALGDFDLIIGSDLLYEPGHAASLAAFIERHAADTCVVIIVDPGRSYGGKFTRAMEALSYTHSRERVDAEDYLEGYKGYVMTYSRG